MRTAKYILIIALVSLLQYSSEAQQRVTLNIYQDGKLAFQGDDHGNEPGTLDLVIRSEWQGRQSEIGYLFVYPHLEYARLAGGDFTRYAIGVGYGFNTWSKLVDFSPSVNWGLLDRFDRSFQTWEFAGDVSFKISDRFRLAILGSFTQRKDLEYQSQGDISKFQFNGYMGLKYRFNKIKNGKKH